MDWAKSRRRAASSLARAEEAMDRRIDFNPNRATSGGPCSKCGALTLQRTNRKTAETFFGCTLYPRCSGSWKPPMP